MNHRRFGVLKIFIMAVVFALPLCLSWLYLRPMYRSHTIAIVQGLVLDEMTECVDEHLMDTDTSEWFSTRDTSPTTHLSYLDLSDVSRFQTEVSDEANQRLGDLSTSPVRVTMGALAGWPFWLNRGPKLYARFHIQGPVHAKIDLANMAAGIDSTHIVNLSMTAHVHVFGLFLNRTILVKESTPIAYFLVSPR
jgi:hypothetical protein